MQLRTVVVTVVLCFLTFCHRAFAGPTIFGSTGLVYNPTARIAPQGQLNLQASYLRERPPGIEARGLNLSGAVGLASRLELSVGAIDGRIRGTTNLDTSGVGGGLKYLLREESGSSPAIAVGVQHVNVLKMDTAYLVLSKKLNPKENADWHLGIRFDKMDAARSVTGNDESEITFYAGVDAAISPRLRFLGELNTRHAGLAKAPVTATLHYALSERVTVFGGLARLSPGSGWIVGVTYGFGDEGDEDDEQ